MNKSNSSKLYISLLPIIVLVLLVLGVGYFLTKGDLKIGEKSNKVSARGLEGFPTTVITSNQLEKQRLVIKSQEELDAFIAKIDSSGQLKVNDNVNFNKEFVLAVTSETLETDGYELKIDRIIDDKDDGEVTVSLLLTEPGETCETQKVTNVVVDLVAIKQTEIPIEFERFKRTEECN